MSPQGVVMMMNRLINDRPVKRGYWAQMRSLGISLHSKRSWNYSYERPSWA